MLKSKKIFPVLTIIISVFILSCQNDSSSPLTKDKRTYKIRGAVINLNGSGIRDVNIQIAGSNYSADDTTGAEGVFGFENVKPGDYRIKAYKDSCYFIPAEKDILVEKTDIDTLNFISVEHYINGKVLDIMTDKGVEGAIVMFGATKRFVSGISYLDTFVTDSSGDYEFFDLIKDEYNGYGVNFKKNNLDYWDNQSGYYSFDPKFFNDAETVIPTFYFSSEKLTIIKAEFSEDTKTLYLEWTPSVSPYVSGYMLSQRRYPFGYIGQEYNHTSGRGYPQNNAIITINQKFIESFYENDVISGDMYFAVSVYYTRGSSGDFNYFNGPISDAVSVRLSW